MGLIQRFTALFRQRSTDVDVATTSDETPKLQRISDISNLFTANRHRLEVVRKSRDMYKTDMRVRRIVSTLARDATKGGFTIKSTNARAVEVAERMVERVNLRDHLDDYMRLTLRDGDTFLEVGVNAQAEICELTRKPTLEMRRASDEFDRFSDPSRAYWWADETWWGMEVPSNAVWFAQWQIIHARWDHDEGSRYGAPLFAAATSAFKRYTEGETDIAVRRKTRAGMKYLHVVEGASEPELEAYKERNQDSLTNPHLAVADFYTSKAGSISAIQGDAKLEEIGDVVHHIRSFWTASPVPMSLIGYGQDLNRDVLDKQKEQYDEELPVVTKWNEDEIVRPLIDLQLLFDGILPESAAYEVVWASKKVLTPAMLRDAADAALRLRTLGMPDELILQILAPFLPGVDVSAIVLAAGSDTQRIADAAVGL
ncbi:hypothetical protein TFLX_03142 [Thermoflexales bacterium]|nr:hypothetical protein TFLX_03142 [Thermoflexales bacterium]